MHGSRSPHTTKKITKIKGFLAILVRVPWKITKLPSQPSMLGHHRPTSETPFKWCFAGGPMMARFECYLTLVSTIFSAIKKRVSELDPLWQNFLDPQPAYSIGPPFEWRSFVGQKRSYFVNFRLVGGIMSMAPCSLLKMNDKSYVSFLVSPFCSTSEDFLSPLPSVACDNFASITLDVCCQFRKQITPLSFTSLRPLFVMTSPFLCIMINFGTAVMLYFILSSLEKKQH